MKLIKTYSELMTLKTFEERLEYLKLPGTIGSETFGYDRYINQKFYRSPEWRRLRNDIFIRDNGCDLAIEDRPVYGSYIIHHMNPIAVTDIVDATDFLMNPEYLITVVRQTHDAIHYGSDVQSIKPTERKPNDTRLW